MPVIVTFWETCMAAKAIYDYCFPENEESAQSGFYQERYCLINVDNKKNVEDADMIRTTKHLVTQLNQFPLDDYLRVPLVP